MGTYEIHPKGVFELTGDGNLLFFRTRREEQPCYVSACLGVSRFPHLIQWTIAAVPLLEPRSPAGVFLKHAQLSGHCRHGITKLSVLCLVIRVSLHFPVCGSHCLVPSR